MRQFYLRSLVTLVTLVCYYFGVSLIQIPQWTFIFGGYVALGFVFGFLFGRRVLTSFALVFVLGFLGAMLSIVSYGVLVSQDILSQTLQDFASFFAASFFVGIAAAAGASINTVFTWVVRRRYGKGKSPRNRQANEDRPQSAGVI